jgi:hypothetical protein
MDFTEASSNSSTLKVENEQEEEEDDDDDDDVKQESRTLLVTSVEQDAQAPRHNKEPQEPNDIEHKGITNF